MKKILFIILVLLSVGLTVNAQTYTREGNTFISSMGERSKSEAIKTKFTWKDNKGNEYPVYMSKSGSCFVIRISKKTGKEYKSYLGPEISEQICKELDVEYKSKKGNK